MKLISINLGKEETLVRPNRSEQTGIFKRPAAGPVPITKDGLPGDFIGDKKHHGGPDQAVYVYGMGDYAWWAEELGYELSPGTFGENLTISELESPAIRIGEVLRLGEVTLQVTAPRIPCGTLAGRMKIPEFVKQFRFAGRPGLYCRVLSEGMLAAGEQVTVEKFGGETVSIGDAMKDYYEPDLTKSSIQRFLNAPIAIRLRKEKEEQLAKLRP